jgi:hypothetical protein
MNTTEFYASVCDCTNTETQCPGVVNSRATGWPPRGFFTEADHMPVDLLAVCKNPGHLLPDEALLYQGRSGTEIAQIHINFARSTFKGDNDLSAEARRSTTFHKNLIRYLSFFLNVPPEQVFRHVAYTNLVKCSSHGERDSLKSKTMTECFSRHFVREIAYFKPKAILAFGRETERFLVEARSRQFHALPVIYVKHPSYYYRKDNEYAILSHIKAEVLGYVGA